MSELRSCLYEGTVVHKRLRPREHGFSYRVFSLCLDVDEIGTLASTLRLFSRNRANVVSFFDRDHGDGSADDIGTHARRLLAEAGLGRWGARIELLCAPRVLGYVFNPLSVYFCHDDAGQLGVVVYEVSNTFGERKSYIVPRSFASGEGEGDDGHAFAQSCTKEMYVSPFTRIGHYGFRIRPPDENVLVGVTLRTAEGPVLKTHFRGERRGLTDLELARQLLRRPLVTMTVTAAIHLEAARLWLKGVPLVPRHRSPKFSTSVADVAKGAAPHVST